MEIENMINRCKVKMAELQELIIGINNEIGNKEFKPSASQQEIIDCYLHQGKSLLMEIERLEKLKGNFEW